MRGVRCQVEFHWMPDMVVQTTTQFDPMVYAGGNRSEAVRFGGPVWSPDGSQMVWIVEGHLTGSGRLARPCLT